MSTNEPHASDCIALDSFACQSLVRVQHTLLVFHYVPTFHHPNVPFLTAAPTPSSGLSNTVFSPNTSMYTPAPTPRIVVVSRKEVKVRNGILWFCSVQHHELNTRICLTLVAKSGELNNKVFLYQR
jgi:hypothetical protein